MLLRYREWSQLDIHRRCSTSSASSSLIFNINGIQFDFNELWIHELNNAAKQPRRSKWDWMNRNRNRPKMCPSKIGRIQHGRPRSCTRGIQIEQSSNWWSNYKARSIFVDHMRIDRSIRSFGMCECAGSKQIMFVCWWVCLLWRIKSCQFVCQFHAAIVAKFNSRSYSVGLQVDLLSETIVWNGNNQHNQNNHVIWYISKARKISQCMLKTHKPFNACSTIPVRLTELFGNKSLLALVVNNFHENVKYADAALENGGWAKWNAKLFIGVGMDRVAVMVRNGYDNTTAMAPGQFLGRIPKSLRSFEWSDDGWMAKCFGWDTLENAKAGWGQLIISYLRHTHIQTHILAAR